MNGGTSLDTEAHSEEHHLRQFLLHLGEMRTMMHHDTKNKTKKAILSEYDSG